MSGSNPFRHRKSVPETTFPGSASRYVSDNSARETDRGNTNITPRYHDDDAPPARHSPRTNTKTVRIASPPARQISSSSDDDVPVISPRDSTTLKHPSTHRGSPPPQQDDSRDLDDDDPFNNSDSSGSEEEKREAGSGKIGNNAQGIFEAQNVHRVEPGQRGEPEDLRGGAMRGFAQASHRRANSTANSGDPDKAKKAAMDVDSFKRLLLTGDAGSDPACSTTAFSQPAPISEPSSNADAGSALKQPFFEPQHSVVGKDTTNTYHGVPGVSDERQSSEGHTAHVEKKGMKPPPPTTRRGKAIKSNTEPTASPMVSMPPPPPSSEAPLSFQSPISSKPGFQHSADSHKPLPNPPADQNVHPSMTDRRSAALSEPFQKPVSQIKRPPTPPLARRHSQMRKSSSPTISRSNSSRLSLPPGSAPFNSPLASSTSSSRTPPPPPSRRLDRGSATSSPPGTPPHTKLAFTPDTSLLAKEENKDNSDKSSLHRSDSSSISSTKRLSRLSATHSSSSMAPPPPPPPRRTGGTHTVNLTEPTPVRQPPPIDGDDPTPKEDEPAPTTSNATGVLADLSRLQQELDELRGQYEGRKPS